MQLSESLRLLTCSVFLCQKEVFVSNPLIKKAEIPPTGNFCSPMWLSAWQFWGPVCEAWEGQVVLIYDHGDCRLFHCRKWHHVHDGLIPGFFHVCFPESIAAPFKDFNSKKKKKKISVLRPQTCYLSVPSWQMLFLTVIFFFFYGIKGQKSGDISRQTENHKFLNLKL